MHLVSICYLDFKEHGVLIVLSVLSLSTLSTSDLDVDVGELGLAGRTLRMGSLEVKEVLVELGVVSMRSVVGAVSMSVVQKILNGMSGLLSNFLGEFKEEIILFIVTIATTNTTNFTRGELDINRGVRGRAASSVVSGILLVALLLDKFNKVFFFIISSETTEGTVGFTSNLNVELGLGRLSSVVSDILLALLLDEFNKVFFFIVSSETTEGTVGSTSNLNVELGLGRLGSVVSDILLVELLLDKFNKVFFFIVSLDSLISSMDSTLSGRVSGRDFTASVVSVVVSEVVVGRSQDDKT